MPQLPNIINYGAVITIVITLLRIAWLAGQGYKELKYLSAGHEKITGNVEETRDRVVKVERDVAIIKNVVGINGPTHAQQ